MREENDWRLQGQEKYLKGAKLVFKAYRQYPQKPNRDHDHCSFCWAKFSLDERIVDRLQQGYATLDDRRWICPTCFEDFKDLFEWEVVAIPDS